MTLPAQVGAHAPQFLLSPTAYFLSGLIGDEHPVRVLVEVHFLALFY